MKYSNSDKRGVLAAALLAILGSSVNLMSQRPIETPIFEQMFVLSGHVQIIDHPSLGKTPCRNCTFIIQSIECPKFMVTVSTDSVGNYKIGLSQGKYKLIYEDPLQNTDIPLDLLDPSQQREFNGSNVKGTVKFNIAVRVP